LGLPESTMFGQTGVDVMQMKYDELMITKGNSRLTLDLENMTYEIPLPKNQIYYEKVFRVIPDTKFVTSLIKPTGWNRLDQDSLGTLSYDSVNNKLVLSPIPGKECYFYYKGVKYGFYYRYTQTVPTSDGIYYFILEPSSFGSFIPADQVTMETMANYVFIAVVVRSGSFVGVIDERHSMYEDYVHHAQVHFTEGTRYGFGGGLRNTDITTGNSTIGTWVEGTMWDEDIKHSIPVVNTGPFLYRLGTGGRWTLGPVGNNASYLESGDTYHSWNKYTGSYWLLEEGTSSTDFWWIFIVCIPYLNKHNYYKILGQNSYPNKATARRKLNEELRKMQLDGMPGNEYIITQAYLVKRDGIIQSQENGDDYVDIFKCKIN
jgi:hypothetical protein